MQDNARQIEVIIPVYNCVKYLETAVYSVLRQSYKNIEIILVDDGSTDGSEALCDTLVDLHERVIVIHQENAGVSAARNTGIEYVLSKYEGEEDKVYIAFLDADDVWVEGFFNEEVRALLEKNYDLIGFSSAECNSKMTLRSRKVYGRLGDIDGGILNIAARPEMFASILYAKELLYTYEIRFMEGVKYGEDLIFRYECMCLCQKMYFSEKLFYLYRNNKHSAVHKRSVGCQYYIPLLYAYLEMDKKINKYIELIDKKCTVGRGIVDYYVDDMVKEQFQYDTNYKCFKEIVAENKVIFENRTDILQKLEKRE